MPSAIHFQSTAEAKAELLTELLFLMAVRQCPQLSAAERVASNDLALNGVSLPRFGYGATSWCQFADALIRAGYLEGDRSNFTVTVEGRRRLGELLRGMMRLGISVRL